MPPASGHQWVLPCCLEFVLAAALVEENPDLCMDDAVDMVSEWIMGAGRDVH